MRLAPIFIALTAVCTPVAVCAEPPILSELETQLEIHAGEGFSGAVVVQQGSQALLAKGFGFADREAQRDFTPETVAQVGSISKSFTGIAIAKLLTEGRIAWDEPASTYVPDLPAPAAALTIRQIATHRAGLREYCGADLDAVTRDRFVSHCLARKLRFEPGEKSEYSNVGYGLLALVVEAVSGQSWEDYLRAEIWQPLGMQTTGFSSVNPGADGIAAGYLNNKLQPALLESIKQREGADWSLRGNGGAQASSADMIVFANALAGDAPAELSAAFAELRKPVSEAEEGVAEGLGIVFRLNDQGKIRRAGHAGSDGTFLSYIGWLPENDIRFYFVANSGERDAVEVLRTILGAIGDIPPATTKTE